MTLTKGTVPALADPTRLALIESLDLPGRHHDPALERIARLAALATGRPAVLAFVVAQGCWVAAHAGAPARIPEAFWPALMRAGRGQLVQWAADAGPAAAAEAPEVFAAAPLATAIAACPIVFNGHSLGALCVLGRQPVQLSADGAAMLEHLAGLVSELLEVRLERRHAQAEHAKADQLAAALRGSEATLRESEARYRLLWQTTTDAVLVIDDASIIQFVNPAMETLFGLRPEDLIGRSLEVLQPARLRSGHARGFTAYLQTGERKLNWKSAETWGLRADGTEVPIEVSFSELEVGGRRLFASFMRDLTERNRVQTHLRNSEAQFRSLTALSSDWYWEVDARLRYTLMSEGAQRSGIADAAALVGRPLWDIGTVQDRERWRQVQALIAGGQGFRDVELERQGAQGSAQVFRISGEPVRDAQGGFHGYQGVGRNITAERHAESVRRELEDRLRQSQKLESIGVLAGGIAHDFNNVLAGILGNAQLALQDLAPDHAAAQSVSQIQKAGQRGREMVQQILTFARRRPRRLVRCELHALVAETLGLLRPAMPASVRVQTQLPDEPVSIVADATQIQQALINLCANAWQALAGRPGRVVIQARTALFSAQGQAPSGLPAGHYVCLSVEDDGPGIDGAHLGRVFEPFFTTKAEGEGTGLGLAVVHGIVSSHGGAVTVDSRLGQGTRIDLWLPADDTPVADPPPALAAVSVHGQGRHVCYVDDDEVMTLMVSRLLERQGYRVTTFQGGEAALHALSDPASDVEVLVTDLHMPVMSGVDLQRALAAVRPALQVVIGSGNLPLELTEAAPGRAVLTYRKENTLDELPAMLAHVFARTQPVPQAATAAPPSQA